MQENNFKTKDFFSAGLILDNLRNILNLRTDKQLAEKLEINLNTLSSWRNRNSVDFPLIIAFCASNNININWLFNGIGEPHLANNDNIKDKIKELQDEIKKNNDEIQKDAKIINAYDDDAHKLAVENLILSEQVKLLSNLIIQVTGKTV